MSTSIEQRVLALAGLAQALKQVRRIAETGQSEASVVTTALDSVLRIDADSAEAVYGDREALQPGLRLLRDYLDNRGNDPLLPRLALAVVQLERRFAGNPEMMSRVHDGIDALASQTPRLDSTHPDMLKSLGTLYADTVSQLRPRVMIQGNPHYLGQPGVVAEIRALLLAALRSAVLWRQLGGSLWDFMLRRKAMLATVNAQLAGRQA